VEKLLQPDKYKQIIVFDLQEHHPQILTYFEVNLKDRKYQFWERNPLRIDLFDRNTVEQKLVYIHNNPLQEKWNLVAHPRGYRYLLFRKLTEKILIF
jgi:putative transposase